MATKYVHKKQCPNCSPGRLQYIDIQRQDGNIVYKHECDSCHETTLLESKYPFETVTYDAVEDIVE